MVSRFYLVVEGERFTVTSYPSPQICMGDTTHYFKITHVPAFGQERFVFLQRADITNPDEVSDIVVSMYNRIKSMISPVSAESDYIFRTKLSGSWRRIVDSLWKNCVPTPSEDDFEVTCNEVSF